MGNSISINLTKRIEIKERSQLDKISSKTTKRWRQRIGIHCLGKNKNTIITNFILFIKVKFIIIIIMLKDFYCILYKCLLGLNISQE